MKRKRCYSCKYFPWWAVWAKCKKYGHYIYGEEFVCGALLPNLRTRFIQWLKGARK